MATYRPRYLDPVAVVRATDQTIDFEVWDDDGRIAPDAGTFTLRGQDDAVVSTSSITVRADGTMYASMLAAAIPATRSYSENWRVTWALTINGEAHSYDQPAALCRNRFRAPVVGGDLEARHPEFGLGRELDPNQEHAGASYGDWIREAESWVEGRLWDQGRRPWLIIDAWKLREATLFKTLEIAFRWASTFAEQSARLQVLSAEYREMAAAEFGQVTFRYDASETGRPSGAAVVPATSTYLLTSNRPRGARRGYPWNA